MIFLFCRDFLKTTVQFFPLILVALFWVVVGCASSREYNKALKSRNIDVQYNLAEKLYSNEKYQRAQTLYENILPYFRREKNYGDILYKYATCSFLQEDYETAIVVYKSILENLPSFSKKEDVYFHVVVAYAQQSEPYYYTPTNTTQAIGEAQQFLSLFPRSKYKDSCISIILAGRSVLEKKVFSNAMLYYNMANYKASKIQFQALLLNFPETKDRDKYDYYRILSSNKVLEMTIEQKRSERQQEVLNYCLNFLANYPESEYVKIISDIHASVKQAIEKQRI